MKTGRCQVCGRLPDEVGKVPYWTVPNDEPHLGLEAENLFLNPPTCPACFEAAHEWCPHLMQNEVHVYLGDPRVRELTGDFFAEDGAVHRVRVPFGHPVTRHVVGRELIVTLRYQLRFKP